MAARRGDIRIIRFTANRSGRSKRGPDESSFVAFRLRSLSSGGQAAPGNDVCGGGPMAKATPPTGVATGQCLCGSVSFEIDTPARWAWHDHSAASRRAHGAAYATYVGSWRKRFRIN